MSYDLSSPINPDQLCSFDLETTGLDPRTARIVTSSLVWLDHSEVSHITSHLADPGIPIPQSASDIHGITTQQAQADGRPHEDVLRETIEEIYRAWDEGYTLVVYNAPYDLTILQSLDPSFEIAGPVIDPYVLDRHCDRYRRGKRRLVNLCPVYNVELDNAHNSTADACAAGKIAYALCQRYTQLLSFSAAELLKNQQKWHYDSQVSLAQWMESRGRSPHSVTTEWPVLTPITRSS